MATGLVYDPIFLEHDTGAHPECSERLILTVKHLVETGLMSELVLINPRAAEIDDIRMVHDSAMIDLVFQVCRIGGGYLDMDTPASPKSCEAAMKAVGGLFEAADAVMKGTVENALCLVRPPGHHATPERSMGFCLFNNIAICAKYLQKKHGVGKILIVDFDVHHGNGTQDAFWEDPSVMFFSIHRFPFYPGSGAANEQGGKDGLGFTVNVPVRGSISSGEFIEKFAAVLDGKAKEFAPEFVLVSAGFDAYVNDPIGSLCLDAPDYRTITDIIVDLARESAGGRIVSTLEGGYHLTALPRLIEAHLKGLMRSPIQGAIK